MAAVKVASVVLAASAAVFAGWSGYSWYSAAHASPVTYGVARDEALATGRTLVAELTTLDYHDVNGGLGKWLSASTGPLHDQLARTDDTTKKTLAANATVATGRVVDAALERAQRARGNGEDAGLGGDHDGQAGNGPGGQAQPLRGGAEPDAGGLEAQRARPAAGGGPMSRAETVPDESSTIPAGDDSEPTPVPADADPEAVEPEAAADEPEAPAVESEAAADETEAETEAAAETGEPARPRPAWRRLPALLLAAAVLLTGAGVWFTLEARATAANPAAANLALTDVGATADVTSAVTVAMNQIFSYSYDRTDVTEKAAAAVLRGAAKDSYDKLFAEVRQKAPEQKLVLSSRVSSIAVQELRNGHARLLVFLDQSAVRADNNATDSAAAQLSVTAEHIDGRWVVTALEPR